MKSIALPFAAALLASAAVAQAPGPAPADAAPIPRYEVEIIVFANRTFDPTEERFEQALDGFDGALPTTLREAPVFDEKSYPALVPPITPPSQSQAVEQAPQDLLPLDPAAAARAEALRVRPLRPEELKLGNEFRRLAGISAYQTLLHAGWVQPGLTDAEATPFDLKTLGIMNPRGTARVSLGRFLRIALDLTYQAEPGATPAAAGAGGLDELVLAPRYRLRETRTARSGELHYFDHPAFGVLVRVTPVPAPTAPGSRPAA